MQGQGAQLKPPCSREGVMASTQQLHVEQSWHFRGKTMGCVFCLHFSRPVGTEAEVTHPAVHCSISVLASREKPNKGELSGQERAALREGWTWLRASLLPSRTLQVPLKERLLCLTSLHSARPPVTLNSCPTSPAGRREEDKRTDRCFGKVSVLAPQNLVFLCV